MNRVQAATAVIPSQRIRPRLGFVGTGWIGQLRMKALAHSGLADIAAICEPNPEMARMAQNSAPDQTPIIIQGVTRLALVLTHPVDSKSTGRADRIYAETTAPLEAKGCSWVRCRIAGRSGLP